MSHLLDVAAAAGRALVEQLDWAKGQTQDWADERLSAALVDQALSACLKRLAATGCWGEANRVPSSRLWQPAGRLLERGVLQRMARLKPRGYAGDYELLARIGQDVLCDDPLGRAFDRFFQRQAACAAVRARFWKTAAALVEHFARRPPGPYHAASVGSGPALDLQQAAELLGAARRARLRMTLVDLDPDGLQWAAGQLGQLVSPEAIVQRRENLFRLARRSPGDVFATPPDFIICSGLFDYLDLEAAAALLAWLWSGLAPGGLLLICNFSKHNPTRAYMEWIGNWYLLYRDALEMQAIIDRAGLPAEATTLSQEPLGVVWFLAARKWRASDRENLGPLRRGDLRFDE